jgi:hypothetical protein
MSSSAYGHFDRVLRGCFSEKLQNFFLAASMDSRTVLISFFYVGRFLAWTDRLLASSCSLTNYFVSVAAPLPVDGCNIRFFTTPDTPTEVCCVKEIDGFPIAD